MSRNFITLKNCRIEDSKSVKLEKQRNIKIPKYSGNIEIKYMKEVTEK